MPVFIYEATKYDGELTQGELTAATEVEAVTILSRRKLSPIRLKKKPEQKGGIFASSVIFERFTSLDRIVIVRNLSATIKAGLSLSESLDIMINDASKKIVKNILSAAKLNIQNGQPLYKTFEAYPNFFPAIFVGMIRAGEASGSLDKALDELSSFMAKEYALIKKVKSAMAYPLILLIASIGIMTMLLVFVMPKLIKSFTQSGVELPVLTKVLIAMSNFLTGHWLANLLVAILSISMLAIYKKTASGKKIITTIAFKIPVVNNLLKQVILVRISRTLGGLISGAMPMMEALELTALSSGNHLYAEAIRKATDDIKNGATISDSFRKFPELFPSMLTSLLTVGERTGTLENVIKTFADFYDEDVDSALKDLTTFLEPIMLLVMGLIIGVIAVSILMPIYQLTGQFI